MQIHEKTTLTGRLMNDVEFSAIIEALRAGKFTVELPASPALNEGFSYKFDSNKVVLIVRGVNIQNFLHDVDIVQAQLKDFERHDAGIRHANKEFSEENARLHETVRSLQSTISCNETVIGNLRESVRNVVAKRNATIASLQESNETLTKEIEYVKGLNVNQCATIGKHQETEEAQGESIKRLQDRNEALCRALESNLREQTVPQEACESVKADNEALRDANAGLQAELAGARAARAVAFQQHEEMKTHAQNLNSGWEGCIEKLAQSEIELSEARRVIETLRNRTTHYEQMLYRTREELVEERRVHAMTRMRAAAEGCRSQKLQGQLNDSVRAREALAALVAGHDASFIPDAVLNEARLAVVKGETQSIDQIAAIGVTRVTIGKDGSVVIDGGNITVEGNVSIQAVQ